MQREGGLVDQNKRSFGVRHLEKLGYLGATYRTKQKAQGG